MLAIRLVAELNSVLAIGKDCVGDRPTHRSPTHASLTHRKIANTCLINSQKAKSQKAWQQRFGDRLWLGMRLSRRHARCTL
jgi:hypothetical protein